MKIFVFILLFHFLAEARFFKPARFNSSAQYKMKIFKNQNLSRFNNSDYQWALSELAPDQSLNLFKQNLEPHRNHLNEIVNEKRDSFFMLWLKTYLTEGSEKQLRPYVLSFESLGALNTIKNIEGKTAKDIYEEQTGKTYPKLSLIQQIKNKVGSALQISNKTSQVSVFSVKDTQVTNRSLEKAVITFNRDLHKGSWSEIQTQLDQIKFLLNNGANIFAKSKNSDLLIIENVEAPWILENLLNLLKDLNLINSAPFYKKNNIFLNLSGDREKNVKEVLSFALYLKEIKHNQQYDELSKISIEPLIELDTFPKLVYSSLKELNIELSLPEHQHLIFIAMEKAKHPESIIFFAKEIGLSQLDNKNPLFAMTQNPKRKMLIDSIKDLEFDFSTKNSEGDSALFYILKNDKEHGDYLVNQLLDSALINHQELKVQTDFQNNNLLHIAARYQHHESFRKLKSMDFDLSQKNDLGLTPLHELAIHSKESAEQFIFELQDPRIIDFKGRTPGVLAAFLNQQYQPIQPLVYDLKTQTPFSQDNMQLMFYLLHLNSKVHLDPLFISHRSNFLSKSHKYLMEQKHSWLRTPLKRVLNNYLKQRHKMLEMIEESKSLEEIVEQYQLTQSVLNKLGFFISKGKDAESSFRFRLKTNLMHDLLEFNRLDYLSDLILHYPQYNKLLWQKNSLGQSVLIQSFAKIDRIDFIDLLMSSPEKEIFALDQWNQSLIFYLSLNPHPEVSRYALTQLKNMDPSIFKVHPSNEFFLDEFLFWMNTRDIESIKPLVEHLFFPRENRIGKWLRAVTDKDSYNKDFYEKMLQAIKTNPLLDKQSSELKDLLQSIKQIKEDL